MSTNKGRFSGVCIGSEYTDEQIEVMLALDRYKRKNLRPAPTWLEVLAVFKSLGYRRVEEIDRDFFSDPDELTSD